MAAALTLIYPAPSTQSLCLSPQGPHAQGQLWEAGSVTAESVCSVP